jgi:hypothetical protein
LRKEVEASGGLMPANITDQDWKSIESDNFRLTERSADQVKTHSGLAHETYSDDSDDYDYFGIEEDGLTFNSDDELVSQAVRFIGTIVELVDPSLAEQRDIEEIKQEPDPTVRETLILARRGQGKFRLTCLKFGKGVP